jgi:hypothetical protein
VSIINHNIDVPSANGVIQMLCYHFNAFDDSFYKILPPLFGMRINSIVILFSLGLASAFGQPAKRTPDQVVVVFNVNSPVSKEIARGYADRRGVKNLISIHCQDSAVNSGNETMTLTEYQNSIEAPVRGYLALHTNIDFIVLAKGVPIRLTGSGMGSCDEHSRKAENIRGHPSRRPGLHESA